MNIKINEMEKKYRQEIQTIFNELTREKFPDTKIKCYSKFGDGISDFFHLTAFKEYDDYVKILNQIEEYDAKLVEDLEEYLHKEVNLIALLSLHVSIDKLHLYKNH